MTFQQTSSKLSILSNLQISGKNSYNFKKSNDEKIKVVPINREILQQYDIL